MWPEHYFALCRDASGWAGNLRSAAIFFKLFIADTVSAIAKISGKPIRTLLRTISLKKLVPKIQEVCAQVFSRFRACLRSAL
jgi:hypothetical protein